MGAVVYSSGERITYSYNTNSQASVVKTLINGNETISNNYYDSESKPTASSISINDDDYQQALAYDGLGRITSTKWQDISSTPVDLFTTSYTYLNNRDDSTYTTNVLASVTNGNLGTIGYEYDNNGNIISITQNSQVIAYQYNELNELVRENNEKTNQTITYQYDLGGNILSRKTYPYTTQSDLSGLTYTEHTYAYGDSEWKDLLTSYDGSPITYDNVGNPLTYREATLDWQRGRQLKSYTKNNITSLCEYNHDGIRTAKSVGGVVTNYLVNGTQVLAATTNNNTQYYHYNSNGQLMSINYNGMEYGVVRNGQNDVIALIDGSGDVVVEYSYSSYGEILSITGSMATTLGEANPFRYRGYIFDNESGFYYLQSRYYDPQVGRFINGDDTTILSMTQGMILGANLFAYCENNPVNNSDPSGHWALGLYSSRHVKNEGFSIKISRSFLSKSFCLLYAKDVVRCSIGTGPINNRKYCGMSALRIAVELFAHAYAYYNAEPLQRLLAYFGMKKSIFSTIMREAGDTNVNNDDYKEWAYYWLWYHTSIMEISTVY